MPRTFSIVLEDEQTHRTIRRVVGLSEATAAELVRAVDRHAEVSTVAGNIMQAVRELGAALAPVGRALEPLVKDVYVNMPRKPRRRGR